MARQTTDLVNDCTAATTEVTFLDAVDQVTGSMIFRHKSTYNDISDVSASQMINCGEMDCFSATGTSFSVSTSFTVATDF